MRKCAAILCAVLLTGSLCACKKKAPASADQTSDTTTTTTAATTTTADDSVKTPLNLTYASPFSDGVAFVRYRDASGVEQSAAINTAGDILFAVPEEMPLDGAGYKNGIRVVGNVVYDKTGAVIASPEMSGYDVLMTGNCGGYVLAKKLVINSLPAPTQESATTTTTTATTTTTTTSAAADSTTTTTDVIVGNATTTALPVTTMTTTVWVGVLNNKGEWEQELSAEHPIAKAMAAAAQPTESLTYLDTDEVLMVYVDQAASPQYYSFKKNTLTSNYEHYESVTYQDEGTGIYKVAANGKRTLAIADVTADVLFKDVFVGRTTVENDKGEWETQVKLYDYTGKALANLTDYPLWGNVYYYVYDRLVIPTDDGSGTRQLVVLGKDGKDAYDPVVLNMRDTFRTPDETGFVVETLCDDGSTRYCHYGWDGVVTEYSNVQVFGGFSDGLAAVTLTDGTICYINHLNEIVVR